MNKLIIVVLVALSGCNLFKQEVTVVEDKPAKRAANREEPVQVESKSSCTKRMQSIFKMCVEDCEGTQAQRDACMRGCQKSLSKNIEEDCK
jgi:hypothetical protein